MLCFNVYFCVFKRVLFFARCRVDSAFESSPRDWTSSFATLLATSSSVKPPVLSPLLNHAVTGWWGSHEVAEDIINVRYISDNLFWPFVVSADNVAAPAPPASLPRRSVDAGGFIARKNNKIWEKINRKSRTLTAVCVPRPAQVFRGKGSCVNRERNFTSASRSSAFACNTKQLIEISRNLPATAVLSWHCDDSDCKYPQFSDSFHKDESSWICCKVLLGKCVIRKICKVLLGNGIRVNYLSSFLIQIEQSRSQSYHLTPFRVFSEIINFDVGLVVCCFSIAGVFSPPAGWASMLSELPASGELSFWGMLVSSTAKETRLFTRHQKPAKTLPTNARLTNVLIRLLMHDLCFAASPVFACFEPWALWRRTLDRRWTWCLVLPGFPLTTRPTPQRRKKIRTRLVFFLLFSVVSISIHKDRQRLSVCLL